MSGLKLADGGINRISGRFRDKRIGVTARGFFPVVQDLGKYLGDNSMAPPSSSASCIAVPCWNAKVKAIASKKPLPDSRYPIFRHNSCSLLGAKVVIEQWRQHYNGERPHSSLGYLTPNEFVKQGCSIVKRDAIPQV